MFNLHFHKADPVPFYTDNVHSFYRCRKCEKILMVNRNTGFKQWVNEKQAFHYIYDNHKAGQ